MAPAWLSVVAWAALAVAFASAAWIAYDVYGRGYRQHMRVMEAVWPVTALYFGPLAVAAYRAWGRPVSMRWQREHGDPPDKPGYAVTATGVSHCGAGCTLGDIVAEFAVFGLGASVAGLTLGAEYIGDYFVAVALGIAAMGIWLHRVAYTLRGYSNSERRGASMHGYTPNKQDYLRRLRRIEGQVRGLQKMIEDDKYCIDILTQVSAATRALQSVALGLLEDHLGHCVTQAVADGGEVADQKIREASDAIARLVKS